LHRRQPVERKRGGERVGLDIARQRQPEVIALRMGGVAPVAEDGVCQLLPPARFLANGIDQRIERSVGQP
jgi:hypothetical protein